MNSNNNNQTNKMKWVVVRGAVSARAHKTNNNNKIMDADFSAC